ncbi:hypothetical protein P8452_76924 [Trifolium repens]|nr:hypothetical protein P8452_76924 [Trifolium repens]
MKAYRAKRAAIDMVDGSFKAQFLRLHDYCNEVIKSNPFSTVKLTVQNTEVVVGQDIIVEDYVDRPMWPTYLQDIHFHFRPTKGLLPAMEEFLPGVEHRFCVRHLYNNFRKRFPGKRLKELMWKAAKASYPQAWQREMKEIKAVNGDAFKYLIKISPRHWSKSYFTFNSKCDILVNNMSETFNFVIIGPRQKPIVTMLEEIKGYLMSRWTTNRSKFDNFDGSVLPNIKKKLEKEQQSCRFLFCRLDGEKIYDVVSIRTMDVITEKYMVDLNNIEYRKEDPTTAIPIIYRKETYKDVYSSIIYPTSGENLWVKTNLVDILPPPLRRAPGKPKRSRNKDADEKRSETGNCNRKGMIGRCTKCKQVGHNKTTCKGPTPAGQTSSSAASGSSNTPTPTQATTPTEATLNTPTPTQATPGANGSTAEVGPSKPQKKKKQTKKSAHGPSKPLPPKPTTKSSTSSSQPLPPKPQASATSQLFPSTISQPSSGTRKKLPTKRAND